MPPSLLPPGVFTNAFLMSAWVIPGLLELVCDCDKGLPSRHPYHAYLSNAFAIQHQGRIQPSLLPDNMRFVLLCCMNSAYTDESMHRDCFLAAIRYHSISIGMSFHFTSPIFAPIFFLPRLHFASTKCLQAKM